MTKTFLVCAALVLGGVTVHAQGLTVLDSIVSAHGVNRVAPLSVQMTGTVDRGGRQESFRLLATSDETLRIEYGNEGKDTLVVTPKLRFQDNGSKATLGMAPAGFSQLDLTGVFLIEQLRNRAVEVSPTDDWGMVGGVRARRIRVQSERTEKRPTARSIPERMDLYISEAGLLVGLVRSFYEGRPEQHTVTYIFSDYRKTEDLLLPYRVELYIKNKKRETFLVERYSFNVEASRELFQPRRPQ